MPRRSRTGLVLCAIALLVAGCSGSGGSDDSSSPVPRGLGGPGTHQTGKPGKHHNGKPKPGKKHHHKGNKPGSSTSPSNGPTRSNAPGGGQSSTRPAPRPTSSQAGGGSHSSSATHQPPAGPRVTVTPSSGLSAVQTVTVEGFGFKPNKLLAVAECHDRGLETNLPDCNINNIFTYAPGEKVRSDANGHVGPVQITVRKTFKDVDCGQMRCLVAISEPALRPDPADEGDMYIHFA